MKNTLKGNVLFEKITVEDIEWRRIEMTERKDVTVNLRVKAPTKTTTVR